MRSSARRIFLICLLSIAGLTFLNLNSALAQKAKFVWGYLRTSVGDIPSKANLSFYAYIIGRSDDILRFPEDIDKQVDYNEANGGWWVQVGNFLADWTAFDDIIHVEFTDAGSGETGVLEATLDEWDEQFVDTTWLSGVPSVRIITDSPLDTGQVGVSYTDFIDAEDGTTPYTWSLVSGSLPPGLSLSTVSNRGRISGTPTAEGTYTFRVRVIDSSAPQTSDEKDFSITILPREGVPLRITTVFLPDGYVGVAYSQTVNAIGGIPFAGANPYRWSIQAGNLPPGLSLNPLTGEISGTPTLIGRFCFTVKVIDSVDDTDTKEFCITIRRPILRIITEFLPDGYDRVPYSAPVEAIGGLTPYSWSIIAGNLPPGLSINPSTGVISGTPTEIGYYTFKVKVIDSDTPQSTDEKTLSITIKPQQLTICTKALPDGWVGIPYSKVLCGAGGVPPYEWSIAMGSLPPGLSLDPLTGVISGVPTTAATYSFIVKLTDDTPYGLDTKLLSIRIKIGNPLRIITDSLPDGQVGIPYSEPVIAVGGTVPYTWSITIGNLPPGLTIDPLTGVISGIPTTEGVYGFIVQVKDIENTTDTKFLTITIRESPTLSIITESLSDGCFNAFYSATLQATGGVTPYTWSIEAGSLPPGLTLNSVTGVISGTPTTTGTYGFTVKVTDSDSPVSTDTKILSITIKICAPELVITTESLSDGCVDTFYSATLQATGGVTPYTWSIETGSLPPGLTLNSVTGVISGTPTTTGTYGFIVKVTDSDSPASTDTKTLSITIKICVSDLVITTDSLPDGWVCLPYSATLTAAGGTAPYTWSIALGSLPPGLTLNPTGVISGTPTQEGTFFFTVRVTDSSSPPNTVTKDLSITIHQNIPTITTDSLRDGWVGEAYSETLAATGGAPPYTWTKIACHFPPGLTLDSLTGVISGVPVTEGIYCFMIKLTDSCDPPQADTIGLCITITKEEEERLRIITDSLPDGWVDAPYSETVKAIGGVPPYTWSIEMSVLPPGLVFDSLTGVILGIPTTQGSYCFMVKVIDSATPHDTDTKILRIIVKSTLKIVTDSLYDGWINVAYNETLAADGGLTPYTWTIEAGGLPPGLSLDLNEGTITGEPTTVGKYDFTVKVTDSDDPTSWDIKSFSITTYIDTDPPTFHNTTIWPDTNQFNGPYPVHSVVTDVLSGVDSVFLYYRFNEGSWTALLMTFVDSVYQTEIPKVMDNNTKVDYYLEAKDLAGNTATDPNGAPGNFHSFNYYVGIEEASNAATAFALAQNIPDPFVSNTVIAYELPEDSRVSLRIFNSTGQLIRTLVDAKEEAGCHKVTWDRKDDTGRRVGSGIYFYKLDAHSVSGTDNFTNTRKMIVIE